MNKEMGIFEGYMEIQYQEGEIAFKEGKKETDCPYDVNTEAGRAWIDGFYGC